MAAGAPLQHIRQVIDRGPAVSQVDCVPLSRLIGIEEITPIERALRTVLGTGQFTSGPAVENFEHNLATFLGVEHVVGSASGTDALIGALLAVGVGPGAEVIIPPNSFPGTENAVLMTGATPVLADIDDNHLVDPNAVRAAITNRTRAVLPVHLYGRFADVRAIADICAPYDIAIIEDAAQGVGLDELGRWSHAAAVSFNPYKNLGACGKAGAVLKWPPHRSFHQGLSFGQGDRRGGGDPIDQLPHRLRRRQQCDEFTVATGLAGRLGQITTRHHRGGHERHQQCHNPADAACRPRPCGPGALVVMFWR